MAVRDFRIDAIRTESAVLRVADALRRICIVAADDKFLGSEVSLAAKFGISAPTLRQAGRILEFEQLLRIKRGVSGGYFVRRPSIDVAVTTAGTYLATQHLDIGQSFEVTVALFDLVARGSARCAQEALRVELATYLDCDRRDPRAEWDREQAFGELLIRMARNEIIRLVFRIFNFSGTALHDIDRSVDQVTADAYIGLRSDLARAILDRQPDRAAALGRKRLELMREMLADQM